MPLRPIAHRASKVGYFRGLWRYFRDPKAGFFGKAFVFLAVAYVIMPLDLIPDVAPVVGWLDDIGVVALAFGHLARVASKYRELPAAEPAQDPAVRDWDRRLERSESSVPNLTWEERLLAERS
jgi:uncharacterized membrane protein YkvA (DUF1232 family)